NFNGFAIYLTPTSDYNVISDNNISSNTENANGVGINIRSSYNNILNNDILLNDKGIMLYPSANNNTISNNIISLSTIQGIYLWSSSHNKINRNIISSNNNIGITLTDSSEYNQIIANNISSHNSRCISAINSFNNLIYHNNLIDNGNQGQDNTNNGNQWDGGYPLGGNHWSDYSGVDNFKGPNQDQPGSDGIGDTPYVIDTDSQDNYPLMNPYVSKPLENYTILNQGWNLISIPLIQVEQDFKRVLGSIDSWYDAVQWYDITDANDPWKHCKVGEPFGNDLNKINETMGFWIHITHPGETIFLYNGTQPSINQTIALHPGWNMIGYPSPTSYNRTEGLNNLTFSQEVALVQWYNATTKTWHDLGEEDYFVPGRGYWVHTKVDCKWEVPL
ncbi:MAG: right-handed parallel beta-helix repeat-containing protein, partial [Thermoplasmata archaeon]